MGSHPVGTDNTRVGGPEPPDTPEGAFLHVCELRQKLVVETAGPLWGDPRDAGNPYLFNAQV